MYISPWLQSALLPRRWDVCGIELPPLSLWHRYILSTLRNPYIMQRPTDKDSATEVLIYASLDIDGARRLFIDADFRDHIEKRVYKKLSKMNMADIDRALQEYVRACLRVPAHEIKEKKAGDPPSKGVCAPVEWAVASYLSRGGMSLDDAFNLPYSSALCMLDAYRNIMGEDTSLVDEVAEERLDKKLAKWAKESK